METVLAIGKWDPIHEGHIAYIRDAGKLGDYLYVVIHPDHIVRRMKAGVCEIPYWAKAVLIEGIMKCYEIPGVVVTAVDDDGKAAETLGLIRPTIFAKGGLYDSSNLPSSEIEVCKELGIKVIYGVGGYDKINDSSKMIVRGR